MSKVKKLHKMSKDEQIDFYKNKVQELEKKLAEYYGDRRVCRSMRQMWDMFLTEQRAGMYPKRARDMAIEEAIYLLDELQKWQDKYGKGGLD